MESGIGKKLKVVWICHFTYEQIQAKLGIKKYIQEFSPWIYAGIEEAKKREDIELHVISPHLWISRIKEFNEGNIFYHFFNSGVPFYGRPWPRFFRFGLYSNYILNRLSIGKIIKKIKPDIINLHGAENAYYSISILDFLKRPHLVTIAGYVYLEENLHKNSNQLKKRVQIEKKILKNCKYFSIHAVFMKTIAKQYNPEAKLFHQEFIYNTKNVIKNNTSLNKKYDIVYFARITKTKGIEDLISAVSLIKREIPEISLLVIGNTSKTYLNYIKEKANSLGVLGNIKFIGFQKTQEDVFKEAIKAKVSVLPTYNDTIPGTIVESMLLKLPVISYETGGIPDIKKENQDVIRLVKQGDIENLSKEIIFLIKNNEKRKEISEKAYSYAKAKWDNTKIFDKIVSDYYKIIKDYE